MKSKQPTSLKVVEIHESDLMKRALSLHGNNVSATARYLGLSRPTALKRLRKYGLWPNGKPRRNQ